jgi:hypothetical protein
MDLNEQYIQRKIKLRMANTQRPTLNDSLTAQSNLQQRMSSAWNPGQPSSAVFNYYLPIMLSRTSEIYEYVDTKKDEKISVIDRQEINPYFIELGFFDEISRIKTNIGSDLTIKMLNFILDKVGSVKILKEYPLGFIEVLLYPTNTQYNGLTGIIIEPSSRTSARPGTSKLLLEGTPYDGMYNISFDLRQGTDITGFFCSPLKNLNINSFVETSGNYTWAKYSQPTAKIKLIETVFEDGNWDSIRNWFNRVGYNQFVTETNTETEDNVLDTLDKLETIWSNLISKSNYFQIDINK